YQSQFWLDVAKAELMQLAGRRDIGLNILDTIGNCFIGKDEVTFLENKKIYVSAEDKVIRGEVAIEKFDSLLAGITPREFPISNVDTTAQIGNNTHLGSGITIGSNVHIGNNVIIEDGVVIGDNAQIKNNAHLKKDANIGASAVISNNAIIDEKAIVEANSIVGNNSKVGKKALVGGGCIIGNNVEIGGLVNIAAGVNIANDVEVADGTHISESVLLANNVKIGMNVLIGESSSLKNNVKVGDYTQIGKNVIANNNVKIGSAVVIADNSIIKTNISVCDEQQAAGNINKKVGNCSSPSLPSTPATTPYNCTFVQQYATLFDNLFNGFTAKSSTGNTAFFVDENITFSPEEVALNYSWELGDCSISTDKSPVHKFSAPGTYLITLTRTLNCVDYTTIGAITVLPRPELEQTITLGNVCSLPVSASIMVQADAIDSASTQCQNIIGCASYSKTDTARYRIIFDMFLGDNKVLDQDTVLLSFASSTTAIPNIIIPIDAAGDYEIFTSSFIERYNLLSKQWEQISDTLFDKDTIHVLQEPHAGILVPDIVYLGDSTEFQSNSSGGSTQFSYHWLVNNSVYLDGQDITAVFYSETAEIQHWIIDQTTGCTDTAYAEVIVTGLQVEYSYLPTICYPGVINIVPQITGGVPPFSYEWQVEMGGSIQTVSTDAEISGEAPQPGVYPLFLIVTDSIGNSDTAFHVVTSIAAMQPSMTSPSLLCEGVPAIFENTSTFAGDFSWTVNGEDAGQTTNLEHTFYGIGDYEVILNSTDANGCSGSAQAIVSVGNCYFLSGTVMTDPACGGSLTAGATIILADENYIPISGIDPAISDMYGNFSFTILPEQGMDSNTVCTFISDNGVVYEGYTPAPLYQLSAHSLQLVSYNVNLEWYSMLSDVDSLSAIGTAIDIADNIYVLGNIQRVSTRGDIALVKYDAYGSLLWTRVFDLDNNWDYPWGYYLDSSGNSYIAGYTNSPSDMLIIKYDSAGNRLWYRTFGGTSNDNDDARGIFADADGKVYVCGTASNLSSQNDIMTLCYDSAGQLLWQQAYISPSSKTSENAVAIDHDANGNIIVFGHGEGNAFIVVKYDHDGNMIWDHYQILAQSLFPTAMEVDNSSDIIVTGYYSDQLSYQTAKLSGANGSIIWSAQYPATNAIPRAIAVDNDNNVFVTGRAENNLTVVKYHPDGTTAWFTAYEAPELSQGISIATDDEGNAYVTGYFSIPATDIFTLKYAADGRLLWAERFNAGYPGKASGNDLVVSENGNVYVTGYCKYDIATVATTLKYSQCGEGIGVLSTQPSISPVMIQEMQQDSSTVSSIGEYLTIIPNPYIGRTTILCNTENDFDAKIQVYDMSGKLINVLHDGQLTKGKHAFLFSAAEKGYSPGIYVLVFSHSNGMQVKYLIEQ
ncbi:MAG: T9SS type A sorting domain-containing protein, partial [Bacteroidetes bacterium]|nr:T9SS type A sorting domain-containing protein [Bacteroidota bacterium]